MSSVADLVAELNGVDKVLQSRLKLNGTVDQHAVIEKNMVGAIAAKITVLYEPQHHLWIELMEAVQSSALSAASKQTIQVAIDGKLSTNVLSADIQQKTMLVKPQILVSPWNYMKPAEWAVLEGQQSLMMKIQVVVDMLVRLGIRSVHEQTVRASMAMLLAVCYKDQAWPSYSNIYGWVQDFKACFECSKRPWHGQNVIEYPNEPSGLAADMLAACYPDGVLADPRDIPRIKMIAKHVPLRNTSSLLKTERDNASKAKAATDDGPGPVLVTQLQDMLVSAGLIAPNAAARSSRDGQMRIDVLRRKLDNGAYAPNPSPPKPLAIADRADDALKPETAAAAPSAQPPLPRVDALADAGKDGEAVKPKVGLSSEEYENAAYEALVARGKKGAAGKGKGKGGEAAEETKPMLKRPAAAPKPAVAKAKAKAAGGKPVAKAGMKKVEYEVSWERHAGASKRVYFQNAHYSGGEKAALRAGCTPAEAKDFAKQCYAEAGSLWDSGCE